LFLPRASWLESRLRQKSYLALNEIVIELAVKTPIGGKNVRLIADSLNERERNP